jgi:hypothetical protein
MMIGWLVSNLFMKEDVTLCAEMCKCGDSSLSFPLWLVVLVNHSAQAVP